MNLTAVVRAAKDNPGKDGTKFRRKDWPSEVFAYVTIYDRVLWFVKYGMNHKLILDIDGILADDWEIVE